MPLDSENSGGDSDRPDEFQALRRSHFLKLKFSVFPKVTKQSKNEDINYVIRTYLYVLFHKIYELHLRAKYMNKLQTCALIPFKHAASCLKYLELARDNDYVEFERNKVDTREHIVKPKQPLIEFVERDLDQFIQAAFATVKIVDEEISKQKKIREQVEATFQLFQRPEIPAAKVRDAPAPPARVLAPIIIGRRRKSRRQHRSKKSAI